MLIDYVNHNNLINAEIARLKMRMCMITKKKPYTGSGRINNFISFFLKKIICWEIRITRIRLPNRAKLVHFCDFLTIVMFKSRLIRFFLT